jgi:hypothetical protein
LFGADFGGVGDSREAIMTAEEMATQALAWGS